LEVAGFEVWIRSADPYPESDLDRILVGGGMLSLTALVRNLWMIPMPNYPGFLSSVGVQQPFNVCDAVILSSEHLFNLTFPQYQMLYTLVLTQA